MNTFNLIKRLTTNSTDPISKGVSKFVRKKYAESFTQRGFALINTIWRKLPVLKTLKPLVFIRGLFNGSVLPLWLGRFSGLVLFGSSAACFIFKHLGYCGMVFDVVRFILDFI